MQFFKMVPGVNLLIHATEVDQAKLKEKRIASIIEEEFVLLCPHNVGGLWLHSQMLTGSKSNESVGLSLYHLKQELLNRSSKAQRG